ncbi:efflux RND transporter periplasmic adaptor subunit [Acidithiobacillus thiooxidans]|nr:HlyD family efflux transporter periplasmic adaptor subunit [Acidithiobacillus thiooxidans]
MGVAESLGDVTLSAPMTGRVLGPFLPTGNVADSAVIARIVPPGLHAKILAAQAQELFAHTQLQRARILLQDGVVARQDVDQKKLLFEESQDALRILEAEDGDQILKAPFAGVLHYLVPPGSVVTAGDPIAHLAGHDVPWIRALLTPEQARKVRIQAKVAIRAQGWSGYGDVRSIGQSARQQGLVSLYVSLPTTSPILPGEWVNLAIPIIGHVAFQVPTPSIVMRGASSEVFVDRRGRVVAVPVKIKANRGGSTWVQGALKVGESVVVAGSNLLASGTPVKHADTEGQ